MDKDETEVLDETWATMQAGGTHVNLKAVQSYLLHSALYISPPSLPIGCVGSLARANPNPLVRFVKEFQVAGFVNGAESLVTAL